MKKKLVSKLMPLFLLGILLGLFVFVNSYSSLLVFKLSPPKSNSSDNISTTHFKTSLSITAIEDLLDLRVVMFEEIEGIYVYYCVSPYFNEFRKNHNVSFNLMLSRSRNGIFVGFPTLSGSY